MKRLALLLFGLTACGDVGVDEIQPNLGLITGEVLIQEDASPNLDPTCARPELGGDVVLTAFSTSDPPPPQGTGAPVVFRVVPEEAWRRGPGPVFTADFSLPSLPSDDYLISGFVDVDGDFSPGLGLLAQPSAQDLAGGFVDAMSNLRTVSAVAAEETSGIVVTFGRRIPREPPAFDFMPVQAMVPTSSATAIVLTASPQMRGPISHRPECAGFLVQQTAEDRNMDGQPDPLPRIFLTNLGEDPDVTIEAFIDTSSFDAALSAMGFVVVPQLRVRIPPVGFRIGEDGRPQPVVPVPPGPYAISVVTGTSQNWTVPNPLDTLDPPANPPSPQGTPLLLQ